MALMLAWNLVLYAAARIAYSRLSKKYEEVGA
jgi:hypothetical protein